MGKPITDYPDRVHYELDLGFLEERGWVRVRSYASLPSDDTVASVVAGVRARHIRLGLPGSGPSQLRLTRVETYVVAGPMAVNTILTGEGT